MNGLNNDKESVINNGQFCQTSCVMDKENLEGEGQYLSNMSPSSPQLSVKYRTKLMTNNVQWWQF